MRWKACASGNLAGRIVHKKVFMPVNAARVGRISARTRLLVYGLFGYCAVLVFLGPFIAEFGLAVLGCPGNLGYAQSGCRGVAMLPADAMMPWLSVVPPVGTTFLLLEQSWVLIAGWLAWIVLSVRSDRAQALLGTAPPNALRTGEVRLAASAGKASIARQRNGMFLGAIVFLLVALAAFCLLLGTPLIGGLSAQSILRTLGCSNPVLMDSNPWSGTCGFWMDRLAPYQRPWYGALLSPIWLFAQFSGVLLAWMALVSGLVGVLASRLGWGPLLHETPLVVKAGGLALLFAALFGQFYGPVPSQIPTHGGLGAMAGSAPTLFTVGAALVLGLVAGVIALFAFSGHLVRHSTRASDPTDRT